MKLLVCLTSFALASAARFAPTRQEFLLLRGVASQIAILEANIRAHPQESAQVVQKIYPQIVTIFDANKNGRLEASDLESLYPLISAYHREFVQGKFVRLPIVESGAEFATVDQDSNGAVDLSEVLDLVVKKVGTEVWNTAMLHFVGSFDSEGSQMGYLSPQEAKNLARSIMIQLAGEGVAEEKSLADTPAQTKPADEPVISVVNKMELLRKRFADPANLPFASQLIRQNAKAIFATADLDKDGEVTEAELEEVWQMTKDYLEGTLQRVGRMAPLQEWKQKLGVKPDGSVALTTDELVTLMTTELTAPMWEAFQACVFNLAIDEDRDGQLTGAELEKFGQSDLYKLFQLPLALKFQA